MKKAAQVDGKKSKKRPPDSSGGLLVLVFYCYDKLNAFEIFIVDIER